VTVRIIAPTDWPKGHRIAVHHHGAADAADALDRVDGFDPLLMEVAPRLPLADSAQAPGEYLLLPPEQIGRWNAALAESGGDVETAAALEVGRQTVDVELTPCGPHDPETAAFYVVLGSTIVGRWSRTDKGGSVSWSGGVTVETGRCGDGDQGADDQAIIAAIRPTIPAASIHATGDAVRV